MKIGLIDVDGHNFPNLPQRLFLSPAHGLRTTIQRKDKV